MSDRSEDLKFDYIVPRYWDVNADGVIERKPKDKEDYDSRLQATFAGEPP